MGQDSTDTYFTEIEAHFAFRRGTPFVFSGRDWSLLKSWHDAGIPLAIVLEAIDVAFDARERSGRKSPISSLSYCRHSVVDLWEERKQQLVGSEGSVPELDPTLRVNELAEVLRQLASATDGGVAEALQHTCSELAQLTTNVRSAPAIEKRLIEIEDTMIDALLESIAVETRDVMLESIDAQLARYEISDEETRRKTREANLRRQLRKHLSIPRLSLFG